jgi:hypothetical protein
MEKGEAAKETDFIIHLKNVTALNVCAMEGGEFF